MELAGDVTIAAPRQRVWDALNDPDTLARCIEGVETLSRVDDSEGTRFEGKMNAKVGPVRATFAGHVRLTDVDAPNAYVLVGEGKGGIAGFAKGEARVTLSETAANQTQLAYLVSSSVGGKLAQLGARLIEGTAKSYATSFFERLKAEVETPAGPIAQTPEAILPAEMSMSVPEAAAVATPAKGLSPLVWGGGLIAAVLLFLWWQWG